MNNIFKKQQVEPRGNIFPYVILMIPVTQVWHQAMWLTNPATASGFCHVNNLTGMPDDVITMIPDSFGAFCNRGTNENYAWSTTTATRKAGK